MVSIAAALLCSLALFQGHPDSEQPIPAEITSIHGLLSSGKYSFAFNSNQIWRWSLDNEPLVVYEHRGFGPGELQKISSMRLFAGRLYVCDMAKRSVIVLNEDFGYIEEKKISGLLRDILVVKDRYYLLIGTSGNQGLVQIRDRNWQIEGSFGSMLPDTEGAMIGLQSGELMLYHGQVYLLHAFLPQIEIFDLEGNLVQRSGIPGFNGPTFTLEMITTANSTAKRYDLGRLFFSGTDIYFTMKAYSEQKPWLYRFNPAEGTFHRTTLLATLRADGCGNAYSVEYDEDGFPIKRQPIDLEALFAR